MTLTEAKDGLKIGDTIISKFRADPKNYVHPRTVDQLVSDHSRVVLDISDGLAKTERPAEFGGGFDWYKIDIMLKVSK